MSKDILPANFDPLSYLHCNPDLVPFFCNVESVKKHYIEHGINEGRAYNSQNKPSSRWEYKEVWDQASSTFDNAKIGVAGFTDPQLFKNSSLESVEYLQDNLDINDQSSVIEIGCGVGRVGKELSKVCSHWTGIDASSQMISYAKEYLKGISNITLQETSGFDLQGINSESFDKAYCIVVFMHLDEWERFNYIKEAYRVLTTGGKLLVNNINACSKNGWNLFIEHAMLNPKDRPLNISKTSTVAEIKNYFENAGFSDIRITENSDDLWLTVCGTK
jgi:ubiquinone/menaquinone biosynthesis C-methylase UbiE